MRKRKNTKTQIFLESLRNHTFETDIAPEESALRELSAQVMFLAFLLKLWPNKAKKTLIMCARDIGLICDSQTVALLKHLGLEAQ